VTEQPMSGGAAFWAARGVRIEPEIVDKAEFAEETAEVEETTDAEGTAGVEEAAAVDEGVPGVAGDDGVEEPVEVVAKPVEVEVAAEAEPEADVEQVADVEPEAGLEEAPEPEAEPQPQPQLEPEPESVEAVIAVEDSPLPGFPQQRGERSAEPGTPASDEPAWQLTGGELALPLPPLKTCIEAVLMVVDEPVSVVTLAQVLERPTAEVAEALKDLAEEYTVLGRGFELREVGVGGEGERTGWRVYSRAECAPVVERFVRDGQQAKLTQAALETLAVVAYRQPVSRSKVSAIRGVNCDGVMRTLLARGLVEEYGNDHETGAVLYQTTGFFLERMGLKSLEELPDLAPLLPSAADVDVEDFA
jgi:segregation and condensation protein B